MTPCRIIIRGSGILSALGGVGADTLAALEAGRRSIGPVTCFPAISPRLPVGEIAEIAHGTADSPTHQAARLSADQAMTGCPHAPDAVVVGVTTGGLARTETLLKDGCTDPARYAQHALGSVGLDLARRFHCTGPVLTVSTACSSGGVALAVAAALLRSGRCRRVLAGGVDALCRLTYYGFKSLQLIDPQGARPLDKNRRGMSVAEGAGMLLLEAVPAPLPRGAAAIELLGTGLSCDAHHPAQPHPQGLGAAAAMRQALADAGLRPQDIDYINLHGTGTLDNDSAEALAVRAVFGRTPPPLSSIKGATGHSLAAAGAIEAVVAALIVEHSLLPANTGLVTVDPALGLAPVVAPAHRPISRVLSNSFGFSGNNAAVVIGRAPGGYRPAPAPVGRRFTIVGRAAVSGAGRTRESLAGMAEDRHCRGRLDTAALCRNLPPRVIRRLKRLPQLALALATEAVSDRVDLRPSSVFFGTAWGALSETNDFLQALFDSDEKFSSPTDFIGSVHNAPAGQIALMFDAKGPNITVSGGDTSFEQALLAAELLCDRRPALVMAADEGHPRLSPLFDMSVALAGPLSDGGGALLIDPTGTTPGPVIRLLYFTTPADIAEDLPALMTSLGGAAHVRERYTRLMVGIPAVSRPAGEAFLKRFLSETGFAGDIIDYRCHTGEFGAASALAAVCAAAQTDSGAVLLLNLAEQLTAVEITAS